VELKLLEDYLALVEHHSFTRAAEARFVTQPAFSRRIRSLENWLGVELVDREAYPTRLTVVGREFAEDAADLTRRFHELRGRVQARYTDSQTLVLATQHSLGVSFVPDWLDAIESKLNNNRIRVNASNLHDNMDQFLAGQCDLLLCYHAPDVNPALARASVITLALGKDTLVPVCRATDTGAPQFRPEPGTPTRLLSYPADSSLGRVLERERATSRSGWQFRSVCESAHAVGLKAMALRGSGVAWLPASLVAEELAAGTLTDLTAELPTVELRIVLYRHRNPRVPSVTSLWNYLAELNT
jgi:DNA-binding transcriptional LysR family regulator